MQRVLRFVAEHPGHTRAHIAQALRTPRASANHAIRRCIDAGMLHENTYPGRLAATVHLQKHATQSYP